MVLPYLSGSWILGSIPTTESVPVSATVPVPCLATQVYMPENEKCIRWKYFIYHVVSLLAFRCDSCCRDVLCPNIGLFTLM